MHKPRYWPEAGRMEIHASVGINPDGSGYINLHNEDIVEKDMAEHNQMLEQLVASLNRALASGKIKIQPHRVKCSRSSLGIEYDELPDLHICIKFGDRE